MNKRISIILILLCLVYPSAEGGESDRFFVGVSFPLSTGARPDFDSMRPWIEFRLTGSSPDDVNLFRPGEMHHAYLGVALYGLGRLMDVKALRVAGVVLVADDAVQHILRVDTPIHMLSDELWRYGWYRSLSRTGDRAVGKNHK
jgi:hypothetical protein